MYYLVLTHPLIHSIFCFLIERFRKCIPILANQEIYAFLPSILHYQKKTELLALEHFIAYYITFQKYNSIVNKKLAGYFVYK